MHTHNRFPMLIIQSGARTNLKVGAPVRRKRRHRSGAKRGKFFGRASPLFWLQKYN